MKKVALGLAVAFLASPADAFSPTAPLSAARTGPAVCRLQPSSRSQPSLRSSRAAALTPLMALPPVGPPAPTFDLPSDSGKNVSLKSLMGKWTIAYFCLSTFFLFLCFVALFLLLFLYEHIHSNAGSGLNCIVPTFFGWHA